MSKKKTNVKPKSNSLKERNEHLTNMYMIQLCYGLLGIIILLFMANTLYSNPSTLQHMQTVTWICFSVFLVVCIALIVIGLLKNKSRVKNYGIFSGVISLVFLWLSLFNSIRIPLEQFVKTVTGGKIQAVNSYWNTRIPIILIVAYLIIAFIVFSIKVTRKKK